MHLNVFETLLLGVTPLISANCTTFGGTRWYTDTQGSFANDYQQVIDILACPSSSNTTCMLARKFYHLTIPRELNTSASPTDTDNIFYLAQQFYQSVVGNDTSSFITRNTTVSTTNSRAISNSALMVEPGKNMSLTWNPRMQYTWGNLGGCSNGSLDGVGVRAASSYLTTDNNNNTVVAGSFGGFTVNITEHGKSGAGNLRGVTTPVLTALAAVFLEIMV